MRWESVGLPPEGAFSMQTPVVPKFNLLILLFAFVSLAFAQIQNPIQAAKDAYNKSKQQQKSQHKQTTAAQPANPSSEPSAQGGSPSASSGISRADCCTPEAMKKIAASLDYLDVVGIKLGMTPRQAVAAIKAHNANLKIDTLYARLEHPTAPGTFERIPLWISAGSLPQQNASQEIIGLEFTTPPNPPLLAKVIRYVRFPNGQPVVKTTLVDSLDKKYGPESGLYGRNRLWIFEANAKPVTRFLTPEERGCDPGNYSSDFPGGGDIRSLGPGNDGTLNLSRVSMDENQISAEKRAACVPLTFAAASISSESEAPNSPSFDITVSLMSPALLRNSQQSTHDWLQAELDGKLKQQQDAAAKRAAPEL
jgi:hypothetical protein